MKRLIGSKKILIAVFISGTGSNLNNLIKFSFLPKSPIEINYIISNKANAKGLSFAKKNKIKHKIFSFKNKFNDEKKLLHVLKNAKDAKDADLAKSWPKGCQERCKRC